MALQSSQELFYWALSSLGAIAFGVGIVLFVVLGRKSNDKKANRD